MLEIIYCYVILIKQHIIAFRKQYTHELTTIIITMLSYLFARPYHRPCRCILSLCTYLLRTTCFVLINPQLPIVKD